MVFGDILTKWHILWYNINPESEIRTFKKNKIGVIMELVAIIVLGVFSFLFLKMGISSYKKNKTHIFARKESDFKSFSSEAKFFLLLSGLLFIGILAIIYHIIITGYEIDSRYFIFAGFATFLWWAIPGVTKEFKKEFFGKKHSIK